MSKLPPEKSDGDPPLSGEASGVASHWTTNIYRWIWLPCLFTFCIGLSFWNNIVISNILYQMPSTDVRQTLQSLQSHSPIFVQNIKPMPLPPSEDSPFVFLHLRKGGGTSLRSIIYQASKQNNITHWVPCFSPKSCLIYSTPPLLQDKAVYASHLNFMLFVNARREKLGENHKMEEDTLKIDGTKKLDEQGVISAKFHSLNNLEDTIEVGSCMTNLRSTASRVTSCWNYRMVQTTGSPDWSLPAADKMTSRDWEHLLPNSYDKYNNGCNNEIFRTFGGSIDEVYVNTITKDHPNFLYEFNKAAQLLAKCVIVMVERCEDSNRVISHFMPWLGNNVNLCGEKKNSSQLNKNHTVLKDGAEEMIIELNQMDELLFQFGEKIFEEQLKVATKLEN